MPQPHEITVLVVMVGETDYWKLTRPFIADYCQRHGYRFRVFTEDCLPGHHPSWVKLVAASFVATPHVLLWDADLVPLPWSPPIHRELSDRCLSMVKIEPSRGGRAKLRRRYGRRAEPHMHYNCGLISVPHAWKPVLREVFFGGNHDKSIFWEQGALNHYIYTHGLRVAELDQRWNCWISAGIRAEHIEKQHCLHFAKGSARRMRNIGRMYRMLRLSGRLPTFCRMG